MALQMVVQTVDEKVDVSVCESETLQVDLMVGWKVAL